MIQVGDIYVHFGTAWSTDQGRKGVSRIGTPTGKIRTPFSVSLPALPLSVGVIYTRKAT